MSPKTVLQIQGGPQAAQQLHAVFRGEGWKVARVEPDAALNPDYAGRLSDLSAVPDAVADAVWFSNLLSLYSGRELVAIAGALFRVMKPDGQLITLAPDGQLAAKHIADGKVGVPVEGLSQKIYAMDMLYGPGRNFRQCFTAQSLGRLFREAGFENIQVTREDGVLWLAARKQPVERGEFSDKIRVHDKVAMAKGLPDALDVPPKQWMPLGLAKR